MLFFHVHLTNMLTRRPQVHPSCVFILEAAPSSYRVLQTGGQGSCMGEQKKGAKPELELVHWEP